MLSYNYATKMEQKAVKDSKVAYFHHKDKWVEMANAKIAAAEATQPASAIPIERNKLINKAYAEMYFSNPEIFKWAGLAAFASKAAGEKLELLRLGSFLKLPAKLATKTLGLPLWFTLGTCNYVYAIVAEGNKAIYEDIYWQHLAYRAGGLAEIEKIYRQGDLPASVFAAWVMLDEGRQDKNEELIWRGNTLLLEYEQQQIIQPVLYEGKLQNVLWSALSIVHSFTGILLTSPVPDEKHTFRDCVPDGNLGVYSDRWQWCVENIMPDWKVYEKQNPLKVAILLRRFIDIQ